MQIGYESTTFEPSNVEPIYRKLDYDDRPT